MKTGKSLAFVAGICIASWGLQPHAGAQTPAGLAIQTYAGLTITGQVGTVYSIEYTSDLSPTNAVEWRCLAFLRLSAPSNLWVDSAAPRAARRFYRVVSFGPPTNMVFIPPGTFRMGSPTNEVDRDSEEGPQTEVTITPSIACVVPRRVFASAGEWESFNESCQRKAIGQSVQTSQHPNITS